jgi:predicted CoA-binding protein
MVEIFRKSEEVLGIAKEAINIGSKVLWTQLGIIDAEAFKMAKNEGLKVVMNRCPKIELKK